MATETTDAIHPSRSMPHCTDCAHRQGGNCNHPSLPVYLIDGTAAIGLRDARRSTRKGQPLPEGELICGVDARLFTPQTNPAEDRAQ